MTLRALHDGDKHCCTPALKQHELRQRGNRRACNMRRVHVHNSGCQQAPQLATVHHRPRRQAHVAQQHASRHQKWQQVTGQYAGCDGRHARLAIDVKVRAKYLGQPDCGSYEALVRHQRQRYAHIKGLQAGSPLPLDGVSKVAACTIACLRKED